MITGWCRRNNRILTIMKYIFIILFTCSCQHKVNETKASPSKFKVEFIYVGSGPGIIVPMRFGKEEKKYMLQLDNHSPCWVNDEIIQATPSLKKLKNEFYKTTVADGSKIKGDVYKSDFTFGNVSFNDVNFYKIQDDGVKPVGVIGDNIISLGVLKIDFEFNKVIFTSSVDSLGKILSEMRLLPTHFENNIFTVQATFSNGIKKNFEVDIGFNGNGLLPLKEFKEINQLQSSNTYPAAFSTPKGKQVLNQYLAHENILLGTDSVSFDYSTNEKIAESILGLGFFRQFKSVILDYPNKHIYISR
jgi:hypothetical protein